MIAKSLLKFVKGMILLGMLLSISQLIVLAQDVQPPSEYFHLETVVLDDGTSIDKLIISGPPKPPPGYELERQPVDFTGPNAVETAHTIPGVPAFNWTMGCTATSAAMIAGYYDRTTHPDMYTGPTNGGVVPLNNSIWGTWIDGNGDTYGQTPLSATRLGLDERATRGHIDDYWVQFGSSADDPFSGNWTEHTYGECTGDYMKTNQTTNHGNIDGSTTIYSYTSSPLQFTCNFMESQDIHNLDGTYGWKLFYESRGYTVTTCYNQLTDNQVTGGFSFTDYKAEIDAGRPVMIHVIGHTMVGVGYDDIGDTVYLHDTWDYDTHTMTWGGSYLDMEMNSISIVHIESPAGLDAPTLNPIDNHDGDGNYLVDWADVTGALTYTLQVDDNDSFTHPTDVYTVTVSQSLETGQIAGTYYYRVKAENDTEESGWSNTELTTVSSHVYLPLVLKNYTQSAGGWVDIMTEDFEGAFPGNWDVNDYYPPGEYVWGKRDCEVYEGSHSGWAVGGGADGSILPCGSNYPIEINSWMVYGPFSLETAQEAELNFMYWLNTEVDYDVLFWGASIDGENFYGVAVDGDSGGWISNSFDLTDVYTLGDLTGDAQVWIAFIFYSDEIITEPNGAFIDNIVLQHCESNCTATVPENHILPQPMNYKEFHLGH